VWLFLISNITGSILGMVANSWFADTKMGVWFYDKADDVLTWVSIKLRLKILKDENNWETKYPNVAMKIKDLEERLNKLEKEN
tara:strand:- start:62 stop:310 length:249 start_codon:yes stop_codon:yes gene_type:complete